MFPNYHLTVPPLSWCCFIVLPDHWSLFEVCFSLFNICKAVVQKWSEDRSSAANISLFQGLLWIHTFFKDLFKQVKSFIDWLHDLFRSSFPHVPPHEQTYCIQLFVLLSLCFYVVLVCQVSFCIKGTLHKTLQVNRKRLPIDLISPLCIVVCNCWSVFTLSICIWTKYGVYEHWLLSNSG